MSHTNLCVCKIVYMWLILLFFCLLFIWFLLSHYLPEYTTYISERLSVCVGVSCPKKWLIFGFFFFYEFLFFCCTVINFAVPKLTYPTCCLSPSPKKKLLQPKELQLFFLFIYLFIIIKSTNPLSILHSITYHL